MVMPRPTSAAFLRLLYIFGISVSVSNLPRVGTNSVSSENSSNNSESRAAQSKSVQSSLDWSTDVIWSVQQLNNQTVESTDESFPILENPAPLLNTSFLAYQRVPVATFRTNEATLQIIDTATRGFDGSIMVQRILVNPDSPKIFVSQALLVVPPQYGEYLNTSELAVDYSFLDLYGVVLVSPPFASGSLDLRRNATGQVLVIGLGGAQMNNFLHHYFPELNITVIELQPAIGVIAKRYFGFQEDETQHLLIMDGLKFLEDAIRNGEQYDAIYIDACPSVYPVEEEILCPGHAFLNTTNIVNMNKVLSPNGTLTVKMLLITKNVTDRAIQLSQPYRKIFGSCLVLPMVSPNNRVLICTGEDREKLDVGRLWNGMMAFRAPSN